MFSLRLLTGTSLIAALALLGCNKGNVNAPARVSGKLTYKNQPIKAGMMFLHTPDGSKYPAQISSDGTYSATDIPAGELIVTVSTDHLSPSQKAPQGAEAARRMKAQSSQMQQPAGPVEKPSDHYTKIPDKYSNPKTSPITLDLKPGRQVQDIDLTD
jgi:hypothetical protein